MGIDIDVKEANQEELIFLYGRVKDTIAFLNNEELNSEIEKAEKIEKK